LKPGELDQYISAFEHLCLQARWGADEAGTIMLFKRGLTNGLHCAVLKKTTPHPTMLCGWMDTARRQYELWAEIKASLSGNFGQPRPSPTESNRWKGVLTKKNQRALVKRDDKMEVDAAQVNSLTVEEKA
jgi:hypothetical protein